MSGEESASRRELARGTQELAILASLAPRPHYGYELLQHLADEDGAALDIKEGTLYPILHRLEDAGHLETTWEAEGRSAPRKYYRLTDAGSARLDLLRSEWRRLVQRMAHVLDEGEAR